MLLKLIQRLVSGGPFYVRIRPQFLSVRDISAKKTIEDVPLVAIAKGEKRSILAIGASAAIEASKSKNEYELINGFDHPRSIISDFTVAEKTLQYFFRELIKNAILYWLYETKCSEPGGFGGDAKSGKGIRFLCKRTQASEYFRPHSALGRFAPVSRWNVCIIHAGKRNCYCIRAYRNYFRIRDTGRNSLSFL